MPVYQQRVLDLVTEQYEVEKNLQQPAMVAAPRGGNPEGVHRDAVVVI